MPNSVNLSFQPLLRTHTGPEGEDRVTGNVKSTAYVAMPLAVSQYSTEDHRGSRLHIPNFLQQPVLRGLLFFIAHQHLAPLNPTAATLTIPTESAVDS